jgi:hypothetical protein
VIRMFPARFDTSCPAAAVTPDNNWQLTGQARFGAVFKR